MARMQSPLDCLLLCIVICCLVLSCHGTSDRDRKVYIVYMGELPKGEFSASTLHINMLQEIVGSAASDYLLHSYHRSFNGFVAKLTEEEKQKVAGMQGVVSVFPSQKKKLHTTKSWDFMGFPVNSVRSSGESDMIIGMLDTGIWPESQSFNDSGYGPIPTKWKGKCQASSNFTCNNKIVGARYYHSDGEIDPDVEFPSPRDSEGHGTHTASTAAGDLVSSASLLGLGLGTARGGVPSARIAVYKICWSDGCSDADILAAFDDAIADGVDVISLSVGGWPTDYFEDSIAIGAFHSMKNGILTSNSAGNSGPDPGSVSNCSPWSLSVAASTIDRKFMTPVKLGNGAVYQGNSINAFEQGNTMYPIIFSANAVNQTAGHNTDSRYCSPESLNQTLVKGKIVVCDGFDEEGAIALGIAGIVAPDGSYTDVGFTFALPVSLVSSDNETDVIKYMNSTSEPTAMIFKSVEQKDELAPYVVSFSSRGPSPITSDILKPDLTAPGVDILAAWSEATTVTGVEGDTRVVPYNIISGTSMSCPHASGAAAYVKSFHPTWSPAAIKSALMTTAYPMSQDTNTDQELAYGSGHINPVNAINPGLIYDAGEIDFVKFLCGQGYNATQLQLVTGDKSACSAAINGTAWDLNYPSFALSMSSSGKSVTRVYHRTVTNVGNTSTTYTSNIGSPAGLKIVVEPNVLSFQSLGEKQSFVLTVEATLPDIDTILSGQLIWSNNVHQVRSPIVAFASDSEPGEP
ncbi:cucumisin-like [Mercurialis annua]|uniref:cucumisin-like n=1 Tax=Mercurialis annua TaxID=3986 RepID=UPI0024AEA87E|nr:cucumisin-like [Mercurialis annua]